MLESGVGVRVAEAYGMLDASVIYPPQFNESFAVIFTSTSEKRCHFDTISVHFRTNLTLVICNKNTPQPLQLRQIIKLDKRFTRKQELTNTFPWDCWELLIIIQTTI